MFFNPIFFLLMIFNIAGVFIAWQAAKILHSILNAGGGGLFDDNFGRPPNQGEWGQQNYNYRPPSNNYYNGNSTLFGGGRPG